MKDGIAETSNVRSLYLATTALTDRQERIAIVYGESGSGKTTALINTQNSTNCVVVKASPTWTPKWMLTALCEQLGLRPQGQSQPMFDEIVRQLQASRRTILLDEANFIVECLESRNILSILGTLYRIHDDAEVPIILFGLSSFPKYLGQKASRNETVDAFKQRCVQEIQFQKCNFADARLVADLRCEVKVSDTLLTKIVGDINGSFRRLIVALTDIEREAIAQGWKEIDLPQVEALKKSKRAA
jgi:DNA transposition AAA+ family ATPase